MYGKTLGAVLTGLESSLIKVETDCRHGLPSFDMVGLLSSEVKEARDRVRTALENSGYSIPPYKITTNLSPANVRKQGNYLDLAIAISVTKSLELLSVSAENWLFVGELGLDGSIRPVHGLLPLLDSVTEASPYIERIFIPTANCREANVLLRRNLKIYAFDNLSVLLSTLDSANIENIESYRLTDTPFPSTSSFSRADKTVRDVPDFSEIHGQESLIRAAEIAAAGMHNMLLTGPPGSGKTMIATRIPSILPPMSLEEQIEVTKIYSVGGYLPEESGLITERPFRSPHHSSTVVSLIGGGNGNFPRPGEVSYANRGVLFLDELPEFRRETLETLRQPLESGSAVISRANGTYSYPARFMLVAAQNPCPCGYFPDRSKCHCSPGAIRKYQSCISGPILDRIDIFVQTAPVDFDQLLPEGRAGHYSPSESSADIRARVIRAHKMQLDRSLNSHVPTLFNSQMTLNDLTKYCRLDPECEKLMRKAFDHYHLTARSYHRILKVARTIADLDGCETIDAIHISESIHLRKHEEGYDG